MYQYSKILNPKTNRFVSIYGKLGKNIIQNYIKHLEIEGGGNINMNNISFTMYYHPDCSHCKIAEPEFKKLINQKIKNKNGVEIIIKMVNCKTNPELSEKENIVGFPTFILNNNGNKIDYNGERQFMAFKTFLENQ